MKLNQFNPALQTLERVYEIDPENALNKKEYEKLRQEISKLMKQSYFETLKHHHIKNPYVILIAITEYKHLLYPKLPEYKYINLCNYL